MEEQIIQENRKRKIDINISKLSDQELYNICLELQEETFPEDSIVRKLAKQSFNGKDSAIFCVMVGSILLKELAERFKTYSPNIQK